MGGLLRVAHRGEPRGHRENTLSAVAAAVTAGADLVEVDVRLTADEVPVLLHDATLERLWGDPRAVGEVGFAELEARHRKAGAGHRIPTLDEALKVMIDLGTRLMIDVTSEPIARAAASVVHHRCVVDRVVYAGELDGLFAIRQLQPAAEIALTWKSQERPDQVIWDRVRPQYFNPHWRLLDESVIAAMHAAGRGVSTWTVDDPSQMRRLVDLSVDAVISNEIDTLVQVVGAAERETAAATER